jgi:hypothetical protein
MNMRKSAVPYACAMALAVGASFLTAEDDDALLTLAQ